MLKNFSLVRSSTTSSEAQIVAANTAGPTIGKFLRFDEKKTQAHFKALITKLAVLSGIKEEPDQILESMLWDYFKKYLSGFTFEDITLAFMMHAAGEFTPRVQHFQLLDINFISQVMDQYLNEKMKTSIRIKALLPPVVHKEPTDEESYLGLIEYCRKNKSFPEFWSWSKVYQFMEEMLMIELTIDQKKEIYKKEVERLEMKLEADILNIREKERKERQAEIPELAKLNCRKEMVKRFLKY